MSDTYLKFDNTDLLHDQYTTGHVGVVKKVNDHEGRMRVRVEFPGLFGVGEENWSDWIDVAGNPIGGQNGSPQGDTGIWWPLQPGQSVVGYFMSSDPDSMYCIPGFPGQTEDGENKQNVPVECKNCGTEGDKRDNTKIFALKAPDGGTLMFDTREGKESVSLLSRKGSGLQIYSPSKLTKTPEQKVGESKYRQGDFRGAKNVFAKNSDSPSSLKNNEEVMRLLDLNGSGITLHAKPGQGTLLLSVCGSNGDTSGPTILMDSKNNVIVLTAGSAQAVLNGPKGQWETVKTVIQEKPFSTEPKTYLAKVDNFCKSCNQDYQEA